MWLRPLLLLFMKLVSERQEKMAASIEISGLKKNFGNIKAIDDVNLNFYQGQIVALLGPNGAGKSTLMNVIAGFLKPSCGCVKVLGYDVAEYPIEVKKHIGFLPEGSPLYNDMSVKMFLEYVAELRECEKKEVEKVVMLANLEKVVKQKIDTLSKGYRRRVGFAASVLGNPQILLLDEPTDGLDPNQKEHMLGLIKDMSKNKTIVVSTHLLDEAKSIADRILIMDCGKIKADGDVEAILKVTRTDSLDNAFVKLTR